MVGKMVGKYAIHLSFYFLIVFINDEINDS